MTASRPRALLLAAALSVLGPAARAEPPATIARPNYRDHLAQVDQVERQLQGAEEHLRFVETQFTERAEPSDEESKARRFSDGEIQYLLGDWASASVLFYDLVSDARFKAGPRYADALFYLSDSLYQQQNYIGARVYLRELLSLPPTGRYREALARYLAVSGKLNFFEGIDEHLAKARSQSGGTLPDDLTYAYARWLFRRSDLPAATRREQARALFEPLAQAPAGRYRLQSAYHLGVLSVQAGDYPAAIERFRALAAAVPQDAEGKRLRELSNLSLGRLLYETGRYDEALDRYNQIPRESESYVDSLYEISWVYVRKGDYQRAKNATDILLLVGPEHPIAPETRLLQGSLLSKLQLYDEASRTYTEVIDTFAPARDSLGQLLTANQDPVAYFDNLLARSERTLDVSALLPPLAMRYATTQQEVSEALRMVGDIDSGRKGIHDARALATRILEALDQRGLESFPELQEGYTRAEAVESALTRADQALVQVESSAVLAQLTQEERVVLEAIRREREALQGRFAALPTTQKEVEERRKRMQARVDEVDREAFRLGYELQSLQAVATAVRKWVDDTRAERKNSPEEEREFLRQLQEQTDTLTALQVDLERTRGRLADERNSVDTSLAGEEEIRRQFNDVLKREHDQVATVEGRMPSDAMQLLDRAHAVRARANALRARVASAKQVLRAQVEKRGRQMRDKVLAEQKLLQGYETEVAQVSGDARQLVGRIAFDSIQRVRRQFYELVLKADVGLVDVAFTRKQDKTSNIQRLASQKDREMRALDAEFKDVVKDVD
ncbi:tetratricopeptide repeat protein [Myxococcaceae bacterium GXIMD 01537]